MRVHTCDTETGGAKTGAQQWLKTAAQMTALEWI